MDEQRDRLGSAVKKLDEEFKRRQSPEVVSLRDRLQNMAQEKKETESKFNKIKAKNDTASERVAKVQRDAK